MNPAAKTWCVYVVRCADRTLYCGITNDLPRRLRQHRDGTGARYTRGRGPLKLICSWPEADKSSALKSEIAFKKLTRRAKLSLIKARPRSSPSAVPASAGSDGKE